MSKRLFFTLFLCFIAFLAKAQQAKIFTISDFDLVGNVKTCYAIKDYGKEEFNFNEKGYLTKLVTRFNENDYDITYYRYANNTITEKRVEIYRDGIFDKQSSIANIYRFDSIPKGHKVTEKIVSYAKDFLNQYEYLYDQNNQLIQINRNDGKGIENTIISYEGGTGENLVTYSTNGVIQKTIRTSKRLSNKNKMQKVLLTKEYLVGELHKATEQVFNVREKIITEQKFVYDQNLKSFVSIEMTSYSYNDLGLVAEVRTKQGKKETIKKYIYQYDNGDKGNWIKQIITPDNTYISRKISYFKNSED